MAKDAVLIVLYFVVTGGRQYYMQNNDIPCNAPVL